MRGQTVILCLCAALGGIFLVDQVLSIRYLFSAGSLWRSFFFNIWINAATLLSSLVALYVYISAFRTWSATQRVFFGAVTLIPVAWTLWFLGAAIMFARTDQYP